MNRVVDLRTGETDTVEVLEHTGSGGVLGSRYLQDDPPAAHLADEETAKFALRNKKSGVAVDPGAEDDLESAAPDGDHQAIAVATDVRLLFLVGSETGDHVQSLPLADVLTARAESGGLRTTILQIDTQSDGHVEFPVRAEIDAVVEYVDHAAQIWARAGRTADEVEAGVRTADRRIEADQFEAALDAVAGVEAEFEAALGELRDLGQGALTAFIHTAESLVDDVNDVRRRAHAGRGGAAHARAQGAWQDREYVVAATAYGEALGAYDAAVHHPGSDPPADSLQRRVLGAAREREILRSAPLTDVIAAKERAGAVDDPAAAAEAWERALELARTVTGLDWPAADQTFRVDSSIIRDHAAECAENAIDHRERAGRQWMAAGDRIADGELTEEASQAYERARIHFERAIALSRQIFPGRLRALEDALESVEHRLEGEGLPGAEELAEGVGEAAADGARADSAAEPAEADDEPQEEPARAPVAGSADGSERPIDAEAVSKKVEATTESESADAVDVSEPAGWGPPGRSPDAGEQADPLEAEGAVDGGGAAADADQAGAGDVDSRAGDVGTGAGVGGADGGVAGAGPGGDGDAAGETGPGGRVSDEAATSGAVPDEALTAENAPTGADSDDEPPAEAPDEATVLERLRTLDESAFEELVVDIWEARGWSTMSFAASGGSIYDIVAVREDPTGRLLLWTDHRGDDGMVSARNVERIAATMNRTEVEDSGALVTDGRLSSRARSKAESADVEVFDGQSLAAALLETGFYRSLPGGD